VTFGIEKYWVWTHRELGFGWYETPILGRKTRRVVSLRALEDPLDAEKHPFMDFFAASGADGVIFYGYYWTAKSKTRFLGAEADLFDRVWRFHDGDPRDPALRREAWDTLRGWSLGQPRIPDLVALAAVTSG